jgi:hypothetical protein
MRKMNRDLDPYPISTSVASCGVGSAPGGNEKLA